MNKPIETQQRMDIEAILGAGAASSYGWLHRPVLKWSVAALAALLIALIVWTYSSAAPSIRYVTEPAARDNLIVIVTATGSVQPTNKVDVSSELSGTVRKVLVDYNSTVTAGQTLAELDTDKLKATVDSSRAKLAASKAKVTDAEAAIVQTQRDFMRKKELIDKQISTPRDFDIAQAAYERAVAARTSAEADVDVAEADLKLNETNLAKACICSPISGVVLKRNVDPGQTVASSFQAPVLFSIAEDLKKMELQVDIDEADVGQVKVGHNAIFSVDAYPDRKFPATIRDIRFASETIQGVVTYKAVLSIDNSELLLRPGMTATAEIRVTEIADTLLVPNAALRFAPSAGDSTDNRSLLRRLLPGPPQFRPASQREETGANRSVWMLRNGEPVQVAIVIGASDGKRTQVQSGDVQAEQALIVDQTTSKP